MHGFGEPSLLYQGRGLEKFAADIHTFGNILSMSSKLLETNGLRLEDRFFAKQISWKRSTSLILQGFSVIVRAFPVLR